MNTRLTTVDTSMPPNTVVPSELRAAAPAPWASISGTTLTNPLGGISQFAFLDILGSNKVASLSHPLLAGVARSFTYDGNGNLVTATDFNGNGSSYTYDLARNLETRRVEASGKPEVRTASTQWHTVWRRPVKVAEANRLTTYVSVSYTHLTLPTSDLV